MRRRRAVSVATSAGSPRSQPSRHDDHDARRPQRPPRPVLVEVAERLADPRPAGPVVDAVGDPGQRAVAVAVAEQPGDAGQPRPEHERLGLAPTTPPRAPGRTAAAAASGAPSSPRCRTGRRAGAARFDRPPPDPLGELAAGREVAPEHRPRREAAAVVVELVAARPAHLEPRHEEVDEPLGVAQLGGGHPVEVAVAEQLALRVGVGRDDDARRSRRRRPRRPSIGIGMPSIVSSSSPARPLLAGRRRDAVLAASASSSAGAGVERPVARRPLAAAPPPPAVEDPS